MAEGGPSDIGEVCEAVRQALARDGRVQELGLVVECGGDVVEIHGAVSTPSRKDAVVEVAREAIADHGSAVAVRDLTTVTAADPPTSSEVVV